MGSPLKFGGLDGVPVALFKDVLNPRAVRRCRKILDDVLYDHLRVYEAPIAPETITGMRRNYEEQLPKALRFKTAFLENKRTAMYQAAARCGLVDMMRSESLARFAEAVTGYKLKRACGVQVILYEEGNYVGPHNDHLPKNEEEEAGYVDVHISLVGSGVLDQYLICENKHHLSRMYEVSIDGAVAVSKLPFWHYTTPLRTKERPGTSARRWLMLATFNIESAPSNRRSGTPVRA